MHPHKQHTKQHAPGSPISMGWAVAHAMAAGNQAWKNEMKRAAAKAREAVPEK